MHYSILDPTGNITALVQSDVPICDQPSVAEAIMQKHPDVEQVGFVSFCDLGQHVQASLRMAGGEFCGNATMSAASLFALRTGWRKQSVCIDVSGADEPVHVVLTQRGQSEFDTSIHMPGPKAIEGQTLAYGSLQDVVPVVHMKGISHVIIEETSVLIALRTKPNEAERAIRDWCHSLGVDGLGLMFLQKGQGTHQNLTPLVYIPGSDTVFWEHSCASGSLAVGMNAIATTHSPVSLSLHEPGGILRVEGDPQHEGATLHGAVRLVASYSM